jgi:hypothetical protein
VSAIAREQYRPRFWGLPSMAWRIVGAIAIVGAMVLHSAPVTELSSLFSAATNAASGPTDAYGFSTSLDTLSDSALATKLDAMKATGANWVRFDVSWDTVQAGGPDSYDWSAYDRVFAAIQSRGMTPVGVIDFVPTWARTPGCTDSKMCPPADPNAYGQFAAQVANRYAQDGAHYWEIWNEPNISYRFHPAANAATYVPMLKAAYTDIKAVQANDTVISGGTAPSETDSSNMSPVDWMKALYADGAKGYFDAVAAHPYTYPYSPADNLPDAWGQMTTMHQIMADNGDGAKRIWVTEFGAPTNGPDQAADHVTEAQQAQILTDAIRIFKSYSWSGPFMWYDYQDSGTSTWDSENFYGLVRADGSHKPSYTAWVDAIKQ